MGLAANIVENQMLQQLYLISSAVVFSAAAVGGFLHFFKQENVDFREVYREKYSMQKEEINNLKKLIEQTSTHKS